jgi:hypothetical protein
MPRLQMHERFQARMADIASQLQRTLQVRSSFARVASDVLDEAEIGQGIAFPLPVSELACDFQSGFVRFACFKASPRFGSKRAQVRQDPAFPASISRAACQDQRLLVVHESIVEAA